MSAAKLKIEWEDRDGAASFPVQAERADALFPGGWDLRVRRCPSCQAVVYSRRHQYCGVCEEPLPVSCRFERAEAQRVEALMRHERERFLEWRKKYEV